MFHLISIAYASAPMVERLLSTAQGPIEKVTIYDNSGGSISKPVREICNRYGASYIDNEWNRGVSYCWNNSIQKALSEGSIPLITNDDIWFSEGDIDKLYECGYKNRDKYIVTCAGWHVGYDKRVLSHGYSCFVLNPLAIERIGYFDENIFPAYLEDCDYSYRARLEGLREGNCPDTMVYHVGSASISSSAILAKRNAATHGANFAYYKSKWGSINGEEVFTHPFNDKNLGLKIKFKERHAPYGKGRDRNAKKAQEILLSNM